MGLGIDEPLAELRSSAVSFYNADGLGSTTSLTNSAGAISNKYFYDSFGNVYRSSGSVVNAYQFTAREFDSETGLYYYRARYYDPAVGRFLSEDPFGFSSGVNYYPYAANNPTDDTDPLGLCSLTQNMKDCLQKIFGESVDGVVIQEHVKPASYQWEATTRPNKIILFVPCERFLSDHDVVLEEYYHVLKQWNTGRMSRVSWLWAERHGYQNNKFEKEADEFVKAHLKDFEDCLSCKKAPK